MAARTVVDPQGRTWRVRRRWVHRSVGWRSELADPLDVVHPDVSLLDVDDDLGVLAVIGIVVTAVATLAVFVLFVVPAVVFVVELLLVAVAIALGAVGRIVLRRPWTVEARVRGTNEGREWKVVGWRASGRLVERMADRIRATGGVAGDVSWSASG
jgi:hypothetical protein